MKELVAYYGFFFVNKHRPIWSVYVLTEWVKIKMSEELFLVV